MNAGVRRTLVGLLASMLAILPLRGIFTDWSWALDGWTTMAVTILPAAAIRFRSPPRASHLLPGALLVVLLLTMRYVPDNAVGGVLPWRGAWRDIAVLANQVGDTINTGSAPLASTLGVRLLLSAQFALFAIAIDLLAVVARRPALTGIPFLLIFTLSGAVPRKTVDWPWFAVAAVGYLLLLSSDARDELARWGRVMPRTHAPNAAVGQASAGRRIGLAAIFLAVLVPFIIPMRSDDAIADVLHNGNGSGSGPGNGKGGVALGAFANLKGKLTRSKPIDLFTVQLQQPVNAQPFYLRQEVLDFYDGSGWTARVTGAADSLTATSFNAVPSIGQDVTTASYRASISIAALAGNAPIFDKPTTVIGLPAQYAWSPQAALVVGSGMGKGTTYTEEVSQPQPSVEQLEAASPVARDDVAVRQWLQLPVGVPSAVVSQVAGIVAGASTPFDKARAISDYFTNPANGFVYSLQTKDGDSGSDLVDFLKNKAGFCQQYAAAMGVMLREVGIPARVVLGYSHVGPDAAGRFVVTTSDAHAWVEAYFGAIGWIPFDPTPLTGADGARAVAIPWAPHASPSSGSSLAGAGRVSETASAASVSGSSLAAGAEGAGGTGSSGVPAWAIWLTVGVVCLSMALLLVPASVRTFRYRSRLRAAARSPDPLWAELADTAVDLGYVWSPVRTPRQVVGWLSSEGLPARATGSLATLARAVETERYAPAESASASPDLTEELRDVRDGLRSRHTRRERLAALLLPASLGWLDPVRRTLRRRH